MPPPKRFRIVFEDPHLIVVDKPAGLLTVPVPGTKARNLQDLLDRYLVSQKRAARAVHRIDRYTSGLVVFAKGRKAWEGLVAQFRARTPERVYLAVVRGRLEADEGTLRH
ncbi:MAG: RluA family pseudouridine synthase, partial [Deltaproteobacteria bacterium]|nr:RluA family pseudouridine synthase [Deltaproteobacteria bacterium]